MPRLTSQEKERTAAARSRRPTPPPEAAALTLLREALDIPQGVLAEMTGLSKGLLNQLEAGTRPLTRPRFEHVLGCLGLDPEVMDEATAFVLSIRAKARLGGTAREPGEVARQRQEAVVFRFQAAAAGLARALLGGVDLETTRREAARLWEELKRHPAERRRALVQSGPRYRKWALCELCCQESLDAASDSAARAVELASLAVLIASLVPGPQDFRNQLQGYAHPHLGNAWRVHGKLPEAEKEFVIGRELWKAGGQAAKGYLNEARALHLEASLRIAQGKLTEALNLLNLATEVDSGEERKKLLVNQASVYTLMQDHEGAIEHLREVALLISEEHEPRLLWVVQFNLAENLLYLCYPEEARRLLPKIQRLTRRLGKQLDSLRLRWLEGRLDAALGKREDAFITLSQVRADFASLDMPFDTALATLELSALLLEQERNAEVLRLASQLEQAFRTQGAPEKALEAVLIFRRAAERQTVTLALVRRLITYMERARYNPELCFDAE